MENKMQKCEKNATLQQRMQNGPKCKNNAFAYLAPLVYSIVIQVFSLTYTTGLAVASFSATSTSFKCHSPVTPVVPQPRRAPLSASTLGSLLFFNWKTMYEIRCHLRLIIFVLLLAPFCSQTWAIRPCSIRADQLKVQPGPRRKCLEFSAIFPVIFNEPADRINLLKTCWKYTWLWWKKQKVAGSDKKVIQQTFF